MEDETDIEIDFNNLFKLDFSYSFETLKLTLKNLNNSNKLMKNRMNRLEEQMKELASDNVKLKEQQDELLRKQNSFDHFKNKENLFETDNDESMVDEGSKKKKQRKKDVVFDDDVQNELNEPEDKTSQKSGGEIVKKQKTKSSIQNKKSQGTFSELEVNPAEDIFEKEKEEDVDQAGILKDEDQNKAILSKKNSQTSLPKKETATIQDLTNDESFKQLLRRVNKLENNKENTKDTLQIIINDLNTIKLKVKRNADQIDANYFQAEQNFEKFENQQGGFERKLSLQDNRIDSLQKLIENLNVQLMEATFNVYEKKKDATEIPVGDNVTSDIIQAVVSNLEKKMFKKFDYIDDKHKKSDDDIYKLRNELMGLKNLFEGLTASLGGTKDGLELLTKDLKDSKELQNSIVEGVKKETLSRSDTLENTLRNELKVIKDELQNLHSLREAEAKTEKSKEEPVSQRDITDLNKRLHEVEVKLKIINGTFNIDLVNKDIQTLKESILKKANSDELEDVKIGNVQLYNQITSVKESVTQILEDRKLIDDVNWLRRKVESLGALIQNMKLAEGDGEKYQGRKNEDINTRYVDFDSFAEFQRGYLKDLSVLNYKFEESKRGIESLLEMLKEKPSLSDLKNLEDYLLNKQDEIKIACTKKFSDKMETLKNLKYLETQIKHIIDVYIKKMEKGENWLLAKKPLGGTSCASCEAYIGDLHSTTQYLAWNKYPARDPNEKYRVGNGYSKMLNHLNIDRDVKKNFTTTIHPSLDQLNDSDYINTYHARHISSMEANKGNPSNTQFSLPNISRQNHDTMRNQTVNLGRDNGQNILLTEQAINLNRSSDNVVDFQGQRHDQRFETEVETAHATNPNLGANQPKIVKIYKKGKASNVTTTDQR